MEIKIISSGAEARCINCIWFDLLDDPNATPAEGTCYLNFPAGNTTYTETKDRCPQGTFMVKHKYYGYRYLTIPHILLWEKEGNLIKDEDPVKPYTYNSNTGAIGWCDK